MIRGGAQPTAPLPPGALAVAATVVSALLMALASANPALTAGSLFVPVALVWMLWRRGEPPALLFAMGYHWLQATVLVFRANLEGSNLSEMEYGPMVGTATWLTLAGIMTVAVGMRWGAGRPSGEKHAHAVTAVATKLSVERLTAATLIAIVFSILVGGIAFSVPGLAQPLLALVSLRWVLVFVLTFTVLAQRRGYRWLLVVLAIEVVVGFMGYFSGFRDVLVVMLLAALTMPAQVRRMRLRTAAVLAVTVLLLGVVWTGIKTEYRDFLNQGTRQQVVLVPMAQRVSKLASLVAALDADRMAVAVEQLADRVTYVYYFGKTLEAVPAYIPHTGGKLWHEALMNSLVPRALDPDKPVIDDSARTGTYTGMSVAGAEQGASISLGYMAESYVDFGRLGMMLPLLVWGLLLGRLYRWLIDATPYPLVGYGTGAVLAGLGAAALETSNLKMLAGIMLVFLTLYAAQRLGAGIVLRLVARRQPRPDAGPVR